MNENAGSVVLVTGPRSPEDAIINPLDTRAARPWAVWRAKLEAVCVMHETPTDDEVLLSGLLDGELSPAQVAALEARMEASPALRREYENLLRLSVGTARALAVPPPPARWDHFLDDVYNRIERRTGWWIFVVGVAALAAYGVVLFLREPWAGALTKLLVATPVVGLGVLFLSVLRERLAARKHDRYSREVHR